jgi:DNA-binding Lrp family transcriptional regulator
VTDAQILTILLANGPPMVTVLIGILIDGAQLSDFRSAMDRRFNDLHSRIDLHFNEVNRRLEEMEPGR